MYNYTPLHIYSYYSILTGLSSPKNIISYAKKNKLKSIAITDIDTLSGCIEFYKEAKDNNIKPIIGSNITTNEGSLLLIALNNKGYISLLEIIAKLNSEDCFKNGKLIIDLDQLSKFDLTNIVCITGHEGSGLYCSIVNNYSIIKEWKESSNSYINKIINIFSKQNIYIELQFSESDKLSKEIKENLIDIAKENSLSIIGSPRSFFLEKNDKELHQIIRSAFNKTSLQTINNISHPDFKFFNKNYKFYLPSYEEINKVIDTEYLEETNKLADKVEDYKLSKPPTLPKFKCPDKKETEEFFKDLCRIGWEKKIKPILTDENKKIYEDRIKEELKVFKEANLFDYFLILKDIMDYARSKNYLIGCGRGSSAGCLISYLLDITQINPITYNLIFSRFYNPGRFDAKTGVYELPDIDIDIPKRGREDIIRYAIKKYGSKNVAHIATYGTLMGRAALKTVFRAYNDISFGEQCQITKHIPDKAKISDEIQAMKNAGEEATVIQWALKNKKNHFAQWCIIKDGQLTGTLAKRFEQAIKLEGIICTLSKHAAGIVISPTPLKTTAPLVFDSKEKSQIIGVQMNQLSIIGLSKYDLLSLSTLDRLEGVNDI